MKMRMAALLMIVSMQAHASLTVDPSLVKTLCEQRPVVKTVTGPVPVDMDLSHPEQFEYGTPPYKQFLSDEDFNFYNKSLDGKFDYGSVIQDGSIITIPPKKVVELQDKVQKLFQKLEDNVQNRKIFCETHADLIKKFGWEPACEDLEMQKYTASLRYAKIYEFPGLNYSLVIYKNEDSTRSTPGCSVGKDGCNEGMSWEHDLKIAMVYDRSTKTLKKLPLTLKGGGEFDIDPDGLGQDDAKSNRRIFRIITKHPTKPNTVILNADVSNHFPYVLVADTLMFNLKGIGQDWQNGGSNLQAWSPEVSRSPGLEVDLAAVSWKPVERGSTTVEDMFPGGKYEIKLDLNKECP